MISSKGIVLTVLPVTLNDGGSFNFTIDHLSPFLYSLDIESGKLQMFIIANQVKFYGG